MTGKFETEARSEFGSKSTFTEFNLSYHENEMKVLKDLSFFR